jgi:hypothetical protein
VADKQHLSLFAPFRLLEAPHILFNRRVVMSVSQFTVRLDMVHDGSQELEHLKEGGEERINLQSNAFSLSAELPI